MTKIDMRYQRAKDGPAERWDSPTDDIRFNRLAQFWRPLLSLEECRLAPLRLQMVGYVSDWMVDVDVDHESWFSMIAVPGLRHQVVRHSGLTAWDAPTPGDLPEQLRTERWHRLVDAVERFDSLAVTTKALVIFHLNQLSYCRLALKLAGPVSPTGDYLADRYCHEVARAYSRFPGGSKLAIPIYVKLANDAADRPLALQACFQGIGHSIRRGSSLDVARGLVARGDELVDLGSTAHYWPLTVSRFLRARALLEFRLDRWTDMGQTLEEALAVNADFRGRVTSGSDSLIEQENRRIIIEAQLKAASALPHYADTVDAAAMRAELLEIDPNCVEARLVVGDSHLSEGSIEEAARWYMLAGELGTSSGAIGWFRAAQCFTMIDQEWEAVDAMAHCLALDPSAEEPRQFLLDRSPRVPVG